MMKNNLEYISKNTKFNTHILNLSKTPILLINIDEKGWDDYEELYNLYTLLANTKESDEIRLSVMKDNMYVIFTNILEIFEIIWSRILQLKM